MIEPQIRSTRLRLQILDAGIKLVRQGLNKGTAGNISVRWGDNFLITPSGMSAERIHPEDIAMMDMEGTAKGRSALASR